MRQISVLFTNNALDQRGGSETYVRDVALALLRRGHRPAVFSLVHGTVADELRRATIPVLRDVTRLGVAPDVIHGHHHLETLIAALAFPEAPVVNFCHGWVPWEEMPLHHPAVRRYVAVDEVCVDRLVREEGLPPDRVELLLNFVDLERFRPRLPLPARPVRALIISNAAAIESYGRPIQDACLAAGMSVDLVGGALGNATASPERLLPGYDIVFTKGRTALEALAVGCATVLADAAGAGPLVTPQNYGLLRARNFGIRELRQSHDVAWYHAQIGQYDAQMAAQVSERVRGEAGIDPAVDRLLEIYATAMDAPPGPGDPSRAAATHCSRIALPLKQAHAVSVRTHLLSADLEQARAGIHAKAQEIARQATIAQALQIRADLLLADANQREQEMHAAGREHATAVSVLETRVEVLLADAERREEAILTAGREHATAVSVLETRVEVLLADAERRGEVILTAGREHAAAVSAAEVRVEALAVEAARRTKEIEGIAQLLTSTRAQVCSLRGEVAAFQALPTLRLRDAVLRTPGLGMALRRVARALARRLPAAPAP